jgi:hypothetical protein
VSKKGGFLTLLRAEREISRLNKNAYFAYENVPMMGFEPIPRFSRERILSPLRLPFRHIGVNLTRL